MFRAIILPIFISIRLCSTAYGMLYPIRCRSVIWWRPSSDHRPATYWVQRTIRCIAQSNATEDGQNYCPKHVELIWIYQWTVIVASSWLSSLPSLLMMHGQTNIKFVKSVVVLWSDMQHELCLKQMNIKANDACEITNEANKLILLKVLE